MRCLSGCGPIARSICTMRSASISRSTSRHDCRKTPPRSTNGSISGSSLNVRRYTGPRGCRLRMSTVSTRHQLDPSKREELVALLPKKGADPDIVAGNGVTALDVAHAGRATASQPCWNAVAASERWICDPQRDVSLRISSTSSARYGEPSALKTSWNQTCGSRSVYGRFHESHGRWVCALPMTRPQL